MKLSIVLTVYNKAPYLSRIMKSLFSQEQVNKNDYEIIAVNDGSTDDSTKILSEYSLTIDNFKVVSQINQGLSIARNNGLKIARGEYVWFVDADDVITSDAVSKILRATVTLPDIIPIYAKYENSTKLTNEVNPSAITGKDILISGNWDHGGVFNVFRKEFLIENNLEFFPGIYHEDTEFTPRMLYLAKTAVVIPEVLYKCSVDPHGITHVPRAKRAFDYLTVAEHLDKFVVEMNERGNDAGKAIDENASIAINNAFDIIIQNDKEEQRKFDNAFFRNRAVYYRILKASPRLKNKVESIIFRLYPSHTVSIYKILKKIK